MSTRTAGRVAVDDDEQNIRETVGYAPKRKGYRVDLYPDGQAPYGSSRAEQLVGDLLLLSAATLRFFSP